MEKVRSQHTLKKQKLKIILTFRTGHWNYMKVFVDELVNRGNENTCITTISMGEHKPANYTEILIDPPYVLQSLSEFKRKFCKSQVNIVEVSII